MISTVSGLSDSQLLEQTSKLASLDHQIQVFVIDHLLEIECRKLYLSRGFSSLFDYVARGLGYSAGAAWRRINAMKLCVHVEGARERLRDGSLSLDAAAQLQAAFERRDRQRARAKRGGGAGGVMALKPSGSARSAPALVLRPEGKPLPDLDVSTRKALVDEAAGKSTRQVMQMLAEVDPELAVPTDRVRALSGGRWEMKAVIDEECQRGLEQLKGLLSHVDPHMTLGQLVGRLVQEGLDRHDPGRPRRGRRTASRSASADAEQTSAPKRSALETGHGWTIRSLGHRVAQMPLILSQLKRSRSRRMSPALTPGPVVNTRIEGAPPRGRGRCRWRTPPLRRRSRSETRADKRLRWRNGRLGRRAPSPCRPVGLPPSLRRSTSARKAGAQAGRAIPAAVKRQIWQRDGGRCCHVDPRTGRRCVSRYLLEIHHVFPYALGGGAEPSNLRLLCAPHHQHRHAVRASPREREE